MAGIRLSLFWSAAARRRFATATHLPRSLLANRLCLPALERRVSPSSQNSAAVFLLRCHSACPACPERRRRECPGKRWPAAFYADGARGDLLLPVPFVGAGLALPAPARLRRATPRVAFLPAPSIATCTPKSQTNIGSASKTSPSPGASSFPRRPPHPPRTLAPRLSSRPECRGEGRPAALSAESSGFVDLVLALSLR